MIGGFGGEGRGASSVIGVILMIAVVVVLAASVGVYVLDAGDSVTKSPQVTFSADYVRDTANDGDVLIVTLDGGDGLDASALRVTVEGAWSRDAEDADDNEPAVYIGAGAIESATRGRFESGETVRFGHSQFREEGGGNINDGHGDDYLDLNAAVVRLVWSAPGADTEYVLWEWEGPNA